MSNGLDCIKVSAAKEYDVALYKQIRKYKSIMGIPHNRLPNFPKSLRPRITSAPSSEMYMVDQDERVYKCILCSLALKVYNYKNIIETLI